MRLGGHIALLKNQASKTAEFCAREALHGGGERGDHVELGRQSVQIREEGNARPQGRCDQGSPTEGGCSGAARQTLTAAVARALVLTCYFLGFVIKYSVVLEQGSGTPRLVLIF